MFKIHTQQSLIRSKPRSRFGMKTATLSVSILMVGTLGGCDNAGEGLFTGAALGAVTGLVIGSMSGNAGDGAAIGAVLGGAGGAIIGDQNERNARYGTVRYEPRPRYRSGHPYCSTHRIYHTHQSHHSSHSGHGYGYDEWWND